MLFSLCEMLVHKQLVLSTCLRVYPREIRLGFHAPAPSGHGGPRRGQRANSMLAAPGLQQGGPLAPRAHRQPQTQWQPQAPAHSITGAILNAT